MRRNILRTLPTRLPLTAQTLFLVGGLFALPLNARAQDVPEPSEKVKLSPGEMQSRSAKAIERMKKSLHFVLNRLEEARKAKDIIKQNCVNDRLTNVKGMLRISEQADMTLLESIASGDLEGAKHALGTVEANGKKIDELSAECAQCIGMLSFDTTGMKRTVEEPESVSNKWEPDSNASETTMEKIERPVTASAVD